MSKSKVKTAGRRVLHRLFGSATRFREDRRGNVAIIVAAAIIPLVGALGLATDTSRGYLVKARLSQAIDAAGLAGGKVYFSATRNDDILKYFRVNFKTSATPAFGAPFNADFMDAQVTLAPPLEGGVEGNEWLRLSATATIPTTFMRVLGWDNVTVTAQTEVTRVIKALDVVLSLDMSGSMESPNDKIEAARDAAISFVDTVFGDNTESPVYTIDGEDYELLHIGFVPWNAKTRVTTEGVTSVTPVTTVSVPTFVNPVTGLTQSEIYMANNSEVPLLVNPATLPGGWSGCIYARYLGDGSNDNDADVVRGPVTVGGAEWLAWEPMAVLDSEPRSGEWSSTDGPAGTRWDDSNNWDNKQCTNVGRHYR